MLNDCRITPAFYFVFMNKDNRERADVILFVRKRKGSLEQTSAGVYNDR